MGSISLRSDTSWGDVGLDERRVSFALVLLDILDVNFACPSNTVSTVALELKTNWQGALVHG